MIWSFLLPILLPLAQGCIIKFITSQSQGVWDDERFARKTVQTCECGKGGELNYTLFVHSKIELDSNTWKTCLGTIIASNLVATSHICLKRKGTRLVAYDGWRPRPLHTELNDILNTSDIIVNRHPDRSVGSPINVAEVIVQPIYAEGDSFMNIVPNDLAFLVLDADFTQESSQLRPVCIPQHNSSADLTGKRGYLIGINEPGLENLTVGYHAGVADRGIQYGVDCGRRADLEDNVDLKRERTLCLQYNQGIKCVMPETEGSPLMNSNTGPVILLGVSTSPYVTKNESSGLEHLYFANIIPLVKYIERVAHLKGSSWCTTKSEGLDFNKFRQYSPYPKDIGLCEPFPWEEQPPMPRREDISSCNCGTVNIVEAGTNVIGGGPATPNEFGWLVRLVVIKKQFVEDGKEDYVVITCAGVVINDRMILTSAQCVYGAKEIDAKVGGNLYRLFESYEKQRHFIENGITVHPGFIVGGRRGTHADDIAILSLHDEHIPFERGLRPICLPKQGDNVAFQGKNGIVAGWGVTEKEHLGKDKDHADELHKLDVPIEANSACESASVVPNKIPSGFLCGRLDKSKDIAPGDAGGPLMVNENNKLSLAGIVSYGIGTSTGSVQLYTDVQKHLKWIDHYAHKLDARWCKTI